jgi:nitrogen fixation/metabolism regulation signal transduction histidine kinase
MWIGIVTIAGNYVITNVDEKWENISRDKYIEQKKTSINIYNDYLKTATEYSKNVSENQNIRNALRSNDAVKIFEELSLANFTENTIVEIFDRKLSLIAFEGRLLDVDKQTILKAFNGNKFSIIKNIGFYTYLMILSPIYDNGNILAVTGVCITAILIDVRYEIKNRFFPEFGLSNEIKKGIDVNAELIPTETGLPAGLKDTNRVIELKGIDGARTGDIILPRFDKQAYIEGITLYTSKIISVLVFMLSVVLISLFIVSSSFFESWFSAYVKIFIAGILLLLLRVLWMYSGFPSELISSDYFSPQFYTSSLGFGLAKSIGDLFITTIFILLYVIYTSKELFKRNVIFINYRFGKNTKSYLYLLGLFIVITVIFMITLKLFGLILNSIIFDSNIKFLDKASFIPSFELFLMQVILLITTLVYILLNSSLVLLLISRTKTVTNSSFIKKVLLFAYFIIFLILNHISCLFTEGFEISYFHRVIIITLIFGFCFYINRFSFLKRNYNILSVKNFSILLVICIVIAPMILLDKIKSQENDFIELLGKNLTSQEDEKAVFLISNELLNFTTNNDIEQLLIDKSKHPKLAFSLWKDSKLSSENFNSAVILIDSSKKIISDFNISPLTIETDSIVSFALRKYINRHIKYSTPDYLNDTNNAEIIMEESEEDIYPVAFENINIIKNPAEKYFLGIAPVEKTVFKNTKYSKNIAYILLVLQSDVRNFVTQPTQQLFKTYPKDNLLNKIITVPVISEFINGELENSTDIEMSKDLRKFAVDFSGMVREKNHKTEWKETIIGGEKYRSFFIYTESKYYDDLSRPAGTIERVFALSINENKVSIILFYYLKFILFSFILLFILYVVYALGFIFRLKNYKLNFRNKLFLTFFLVSVIPLTILGIYTRSLITKKNESNYQNQIISDLNIATEIFSNDRLSSASLSKLTPDSTDKVVRNILGKNLLKADKNFNFFLNNKLISTTNEELYKSDLLDTRINADAYFNIVILKKDKYVKSQKIGNLSFLEGFKPLTDSKGKTLGIISSLSVYRQTEINEELTETLTFIFGSYLFVLVFILVLVSYFAKRLSKPIIELTEATERISKGEGNIELNIERTDEFGTLVDSFKRMTIELEKSKLQLKKAEREAAWRDIARRVAHEIKNPLTPMRLSIQHLQNYFKKNKNKEEFDEILQKTSALIINEIDKLNIIASEFSTFAKLPSRNYEPLNINLILEEVLSLYSFDRKIKFEINLQKDIPDISADRQELNRVFQNIIKNSVQSIECDEGLIKVKSYTENGYTYVEIVDNGCGVEKELLEKLFEPNFSTKSKGMGLGLAITKKALDDMRANIKLTSKPGEGTKVEIIFNALQPETEK